MSSDEPYPNGTSALRAIKAKAVLAQRPGAGSSVASLTRLAIFDRFLCRVFLMPNCPFALKGGTAMLARLPDARGTTDVDFEAGAMGLQESISLISAAVTLDLADHFVFRYVSHRDTGGLTQPGVSAAQVSFSVSVLGAGKQSDIKIDLAIHNRTSVAPVEMITPDFRLDLPRLGAVVAYRTLGIEDHIADKVCATMSDFGGRPSSRSKDLVDLVIITQTVEIDSRQLRLSVLAEAIHRGIPVFTRISVPRSMADGYPRLARSVPLLADLLDPAIAFGVVNTMLHPSLSGEISEGRWNPEVQIWVRKRAFGK